MLPIQLLIDSNRSVNPQALQIGQQIYIPGYMRQAYTVKLGDSLWSIARAYSVPLDALLLTNPTVSPQALQIGQRIDVPRRVTWRIVTQRRTTYGLMVEQLRQLVTLYPFLQVNAIGQSVLNQDLLQVRIGNGPKQVHFNGSFHANEWITTPILLTFINDYCLALTNQQPIRGIAPQRLYETLLSIVPMVNPDGVDLVLNGPPADEPYASNVVRWNNGSTDFSGWKANINGVDLNDQFPALWEKERERNPKTPGPRDYGGEAPLTQPEAIAMADLTTASDFAHVLALHTQGEVIYWGFENLEPPENEVMANEFARVSGYTPVETEDSYAGYKDWFIQDWHRPGFTLELGSGTNPLPLTQFDTIYEQTLGILLSAILQANP